MPFADAGHGGAHGHGHAVVHGGGFSAQDAVHMAMVPHLTHNSFGSGHATHEGGYGSGHGHGDEAGYHASHPSDFGPVGDHVIAAAAVDGFGSNGAHTMSKNSLGGGGGANGHDQHVRGSQGSRAAASSTNFRSYQQSEQYQHQRVQQQNRQIHHNHQTFHHGQPAAAATAAVAASDGKAAGYQVVAQVDIDLSEKNRQAPQSKTTLHH